MDFLPRLRFEIGTDEHDISRGYELIGRCFVLTTEPDADQINRVGRVEEFRCGIVTRSQFGDRRPVDKEVVAMFDKMNEQVMRLSDPLGVGALSNSSLRTIAERHDPGRRQPDPLVGLRVVRQVIIERGGL